MKLKENLLWLFKACKGSKLEVIAFTLLGIIGVSLSLLFIWLSKQIIDIATLKNELDKLYWYIPGIIATLLLQQVISWVRLKMNVHTQVKLKNKLRATLFKKVINSQWVGKERFHSGDVVNRLEGDVKMVADTMASTLPKILITIFQFLAAFQFLYLLNAKLAWILLIIMPIALLFSKLYYKTMKRMTHAIRDTDSDIQSFIQENILYRVIINTMQGGKKRIEMLDQHHTRSYEQHMKKTNYAVLSRMIIQIGFATGYLTAFLWGIQGLITATVSFGMMSAFLQLVGQVQYPIVELSSSFGTLISTITSVERLSELSNLPEENQENPVVLGKDLGIEAKNLTFAYEDQPEKIILKDFNYTFSPNRLHLLVGKTGRGKSTLIKLMLGLLKPQVGEVVLFDDQQRHLCSSHTRGNFIYVPQGNTLTSGSIRNNLLLAKEDATEAEMQQALHTAVADFVFQLPLGIDTLCGERGAGLSEGEAQRIAIARGLLLKGNLMLLDEPTSALDADTEKLLISRLEKHAQNCTIIMVTHRKVAYIERCNWVELL